MRYPVPGRLEGQASGEEPVPAQGIVQTGKGVAVATDRGPCAVAGDGRLLVEQVVDAGAQLNVVVLLPHGRQVEVVDVLEINSALVAVIYLTVMELTLVDRAQDKVRDHIGRVRRAAVGDSTEATLRFRPIMLTSVTTFLGFTPLILERAKGAGRFLLCGMA